jgi:hypothetical protein
MARLGCHVMIRAFEAPDALAEGHGNRTDPVPTGFNRAAGGQR